MMSPTLNASAYTEQNKFFLLVISCLAYAVIGFHFSIRSNVAGDLAGVFSSINALRAAEMLVSVLMVSSDCFWDHLGL